MLGAGDPEEGAPDTTKNAPNASPTLGGTTGEAPDGSDSSPTVSVRTAPSSESSVQGAFTAVPSTEISRGTGKRKEIALTFDAGSDYRPAKKILEALKSENVTSTFFLTGEWVKENPKTTKRITGEGHEVGNHSWDHSAFTSLTNDQIRDQLDRTEEIIFQTSGKTSRPYFRPPLGARDDRVRKAVADQGFMNIYWSLDSRDSVDKGITATQIKDRVLKNAAAGGIVLLHCGSSATAEALPEILKGLRQQGYSVVPLSRLLAE
jgi:peptidoglycan/xylan/chitin deacetylase (PgdA/CDA1 family)